MPSRLPGRDGHEMPRGFSGVSSVRQLAGPGVDDANHTSLSLGFYPGFAITPNLNTNNLTRALTKMIIEQKHFNPETITVRTNQATLTFNPSSQILKIGTRFTWSVIGHEGYGRTLFRHMHVNMLVCSKLTINHQG